MASTVEHPWFLTVDERGNPFTRLDARRGDERAWSEGNHVEPLVHGSTYFKRLYEVLCGLETGDWVHFTDWRGDPDQRLNGPGTEVADVLAAVAARGVEVRGLIWRSHPERTRFSEEENFHLAQKVNERGGQVLLDERVRVGGSHHQKLFLIRHPEHEDDDLAFVGGIDLCHGRNDDEAHRGDRQRYDLDERYGETPPWHDIQTELRGPAIGDLAHTFRERWEDPTPLDHRNPYRRITTRRAHEPARPGELPEMPSDPAPAGSHAVQVLRTYAAKRPPYPFAPRGERSIARAYHKAYRRARRLIYLEDQYLWSRQVANVLAQSLRSSPELRVIIVVPRYPEEDGLLSGPPNRFGQQAAMDQILEAGAGRAAIYDLENDAGTPIYVHAKACVVDDVWAAVGSDNVNLRSWTHDSELSCAVVDDTLDEREPSDPAGLGDGARVYARELRLQLWREHLGRSSDEGMLDPVEGFDAWRQTAAALDAWHASGRTGPRPPGRARVHEPGRVARPVSWWAGPIYRMFLDPDGRPRDLKRSGRF